MLSHPMEFELASEKDIWSHVNVNVASVPAMSKLVLPGMLSRGRGAVVNVASIAGFHPIPLMGIYSATKVIVAACCFIQLLNHSSMKTFTFTGCVVLLQVLQN